MAKNIVICLDGTNNQLKRAVNTNVVRLFAALSLSDPAAQVGYYDPGVGTFSSQAAWTPPARAASRYAGLMFGAGLRQNLGEAYAFLIEHYKPGDRVFVFGFSRGAYTARALTGMMEVFGIFRPGSQNLVPYAVSAYARQSRRESTNLSKRRSERDDFFGELRMYARTHGVRVADRPRDHGFVHFVGLWDTVKAAGTIGRELRWPFTRQLPHAQTVRHAVSIDERRRAFKEYLVHRPDSDHLVVCKNQDLLEVWFAGVHSDVGGMFAEGTRLSDIPLKWMIDESVEKGLLVRPRAYSTLAALKGVDPGGPIHKMSKMWILLGSRQREVPEGALLHASIKDRLRTDPGYIENLPRSCGWADQDWAIPRRPPGDATRDA